MCPESSRGLVRVKRGSKKRHVLETERRATLSMRRSACSLVAFTSSCREVGSLLPQVIVVNSRVLTEAQLRSVRNELGSRPNCYLLEKRSAWVNGPVLAEILRILGRCLESVMPFAHLILLMDCCPVHFTVPVLRAVAAASMNVLFVPSSMTGVLQPLDAYAFSLFKRRLRDKVELVQQQDRSGVIANQDVVVAAFDIAVATLCFQDWSHSFRGCGFADGQDFLGGRVLRYLRWQATPIGADASLPSLEELQSIFPRKRVIPIGWLFSVAKRMAEGGIWVPDGGSEEGHERVDICSEWSGRLRSSSGSSRRVQATVPCLVSGVDDDQWPPLPPPPLPPAVEVQDSPLCLSPEARYWAMGTQLRSLKPLGRQRSHPSL